MKLARFKLGFALSLRCCFGAACNLQANSVLVGNNNDSTNIALPLSQTGCRGGWKGRGGGGGVGGEGVKPASRQYVRESPLFWRPALPPSLSRTANMIGTPKDKITSLAVEDSYRLCAWARKYL